MDEELEEKIEAEGGKRLTPAQWAEIKELWELGTADVPEICERFGMKPETLRKRVLRAGLKKGSRAHEVAAATRAGVKAAASAAAGAPVAATKTAEELSAERRARIESIREEHLRYNGDLAKLAMSCIAGAVRAGRPPATEDGNLKAIERTVKTLAKIREERWELLDAHGIVNEDELPELSIKNLTDEHIRVLRAKQASESGELIEDEDPTAISLPPAEPEDDDVVVESGDD